ncbi:MAG: thiosulfate oxidation carrier complex protein SoxZ [Proteobacteria bacterium]|nr:thiosulfate oxidation carrier complex protein SoxZ [Pseudomonadota bacterium]
MTTTVTPRVRMPATAKAGEVVEVKSLISHDMESGYRKDSTGKVVPRHIINKFAATFNGKEIFSVDWHPAISANPYQSFWVRVPESGVFEFTWFDDDGATYKAEQRVTVA